jgi:hypothetical protein
LYTDWPVIGRASGRCTFVPVSDGDGGPDFAEIGDVVGAGMWTLVVVGLALNVVVGVGVLVGFGVGGTAPVPPPVPVGGWNGGTPPVVSIGFGSGAPVLPVVPGSLDGTNAGAELAVLLP